MKIYTLNGETISGSFENEGILYPANWLELSTADDLAALWITATEMPDPVPSTLTPNSASKLGLKRAFDEIGQWSAVKAFIASDPDLQEEWDLAIEVKRTDTITQRAITALSLSKEQVDQLLIRANALVT